MALAYAYGAELYCESCGEDIRKRLTAEGKAPKNPDDEHTYDSDDFPKGPSKEEATDCPQHCASGKSCLEPLVIDDENYGALLNEGLSPHGVKSVKEQHAYWPTKLTAYWMEYYDLNPSDDDDDDSGEYSYDSLEECQASGDHLTKVDDSGYCEFCGEQDGGE